MQLRLFVQNVWVFVFNRRVCWAIHDPQNRRLKISDSLCWLGLFVCTRGLVVIARMGIAFDYGVECRV